MLVRLHVHEERFYHDTTPASTVQPEPDLYMQLAAICPGG